MPGSGGQRIILTAHTESHDNPFLADGELSNKADTIIRNSTISRTQLKVYDPDTTKEPEPVEEAVEAKTAGSTQAARPQDVGVGKQQNGGVEDGLTPQSVEVDVAKADASQPEAQKAEEVKVDKKKKCACCVVQ